MTAEELMKRYRMSPHIENGSYIEQHYAADSPDRPASGLIYYYIAPGEATQFHSIDCDEYWCYNEGSDISVWMIDEGGKVNVSRLGTGEGCDPVIFVRKGTVFASRNLSESEGTFLSCITVPRFRADGFRLFSKEEIIRRFPGAVSFFD